MNVLCAGKKRETVELLELEKSSIRVAEYLTELPSRDVLVGRLHKAIDRARKQFQNQIESIETEYGKRILSLITEHFDPY